MGTANANIACSPMFFPPSGPSRSQPVARQCQPVLPPGWGSEWPQPGFRLGCAAPCTPALPALPLPQGSPLGHILPGEGRAAAPVLNPKTIRVCQQLGTIRSLPPVLLPASTTGSDLWYFSERRFWSRFIFHCLFFLCMLPLFSYVSFFKRFWFIYCFFSYVLFPVFCTFLFISVPNDLKSLLKSG